MADDNSGQNDPNAWMVTFGDLIMLLLTFFVMLLTMKTMDKQDTKQMFEHFIEAEGAMEVSGYKAVPDTPEGLQPRRQVRYVTSSAMLKKTLKANYHNFRKYYEVREDPRGVVVTLDSEHLFDPALAVIRPEGLPVLNLMGHLLSRVSNTVLILGHTDNLPLRGGPYRSNWNLSAYRALAVFEYLTAEYGLSPDALAPGGCGDTRPAVPNTTAENRAKNRRVEFILQP
ncbi:OmpA family protein [Desulfatiferula olefinivorans]